MMQPRRGGGARRKTKLTYDLVAQCVELKRKADDADNAPVQLTFGLVIEPMADVLRG